MCMNMIKENNRKERKNILGNAEDIAKFIMGRYGP